MGAGLIVLSVAAFRNAHATEEQMDRALSATMSFLESGNIMSKIFSIPIQILTACKNGIVYVVTFPHRVASGLFNMICRTGTATKETIRTAIHWLVSLPRGIARSILTLLRHGSDAILSRLSDKSRQTWTSIVTSISTSTVGIFVANVGTTVANIYNTIITFDGITMFVSKYTDISRRISFTLNKVDDNLNSWGVAVETFVLSIIDTIRSVIATGTSTATNAYSSVVDYTSSSGTSKAIISAKVSSTLNYTNEWITDIFNKVIDVIHTSFNTITKR